MEDKKKVDACYDCGSTIKGHHTALCDLAEEGSIQDLPSRPGTQYWDKTTEGDE